MTGSNRETWIDVAKGLLIILVVIGHAADFGYPMLITKYIYWFHMPAFFALSGLLCKPPGETFSLKAWAIKRARQLIVPYLSFLTIITIYRYYVLFMQHNLSVSWVLSDLQHDIIGGRDFHSLMYATFWFIPCLFLTQLLFILILRYLKPTAQIVMIILCYLLAHIESWLKPDIIVPFSADTSLIAVFYFALGYYSKQFPDNKKYGQIALLFSVFFILGDLLNIYNYSLDLKAIKYSHIILDFIIPSVLIYSVFTVCKLCTKYPGYNLMAPVGICSITIMYLHIPVNLELHKIFSYNSLLFTFIGIGIPIAVQKLIFEKTLLTKYLFLGSGRTAKPLTSK